MSVEPDLARCPSQGPKGSGLMVRREGLQDRPEHVVAAQPGVACQAAQSVSMASGWQMPYPA
jgi:hypothetical protein